MATLLKFRQTIQRDRLTELYHQQPVGHKLIVDYPLENDRLVSNVYLSIRIYVSNLNRSLYIYMFD